MLLSLFLDLFVLIIMISKNGFLLSTKFKIVKSTCLSNLVSTNQSFQSFRFWKDYFIDNIGVKFILLIFLFLPSILFSQELFTLSGNVVDQQSEPLLFGNVMLRNLTDKDPIKITYIENGRFEFDPLPAQKYELEISCLGFEKIKQEVNLTEKIHLNFSIKESTNLLEEVKVIAERDAIVIKNGNIKMNIANTNFAAQPTTTALLSMFPKIIVSTDGSAVSVIGKGSPLIYLNNQRISMDQLNSIPVNSIQDIELINNPSAKYEAEGRAVILVRRKKGYGDGVKIDLSETASWNRKFNNYANINGSLKIGKLELRSNFAYNQIKIWEGFDTAYEIEKTQTSADNSGFSVGDRPQFIGGFGFYYQLNEGDYFSGNANLRKFTTTGPIISTSNTYDNGTLIDHFDTQVNEKGNRSFFTSNLNYNKQLTKYKANLFFGLQYSKYIRDVDSEVTNSENGNPFEILENRDQDFTINAYAARIDFEKKIFNGMNWEVGANLAGAQAEAFSEFTYLIPMSFSNAFYDYSERNMAYYTQLSGAYKKIEYSIGVRSEETTVEGGFRSSDDLTIDLDQLIPFPKVMISFPLDSNFNLTLNYAKTIRRPNYLNSSSISTYLNPFLEYTRNVNLQSSTTGEFSANLQYKRQSIELSYSEQKNPTFVSIMLSDSNGRLISSPINIERQREFIFSFLNRMAKKKWSATNYIRFAWTKLEDASAVFQGVTPSAYIYSRHQFRLQKGVSLGATFWGLTKRKTGIAETQSYSNLDFFISKTFKKKLTATLNFNDVYRGFEIVSYTDINDIQRDETRFSDRKAFVISLRYSFGKEFKSKYKNKDVDGNLDRMK